MIIKTKITYDYHAHISGVGTEEEPLLDQHTDAIIFTNKPEDELAMFLDELIEACNFKAPEILAPTIASIVTRFRNQLARAIIAEGKREGL